MPLAVQIVGQGLRVRGADVSPAVVDLVSSGHAPSASTPGQLRASAGYGCEPGTRTAHLSYVITVADLSGSDPVLAMACEHVRHAVVTAPQAWPRVFTLKELVRRGQEIRPRRPGQSVASWLARIHDGRDHSALLGDSPDDDVADPIGGPLKAYTATANLLDQLVGRFVELCWGQPGRA